MKRPQYVFRPNLNEPQHRRAWELLQQMPSARRKEFLVQAILAAEQTDRLEKSIRKVVRDIVNQQGRKYTEHLLSATMEAGFDLHAIPAVLLGGGASVVSRHLSPKDGLCKTIFLLDDKVNAVGFERALTAVSRRKSEASSIGYDLFHFGAL